jgi:hypothetical protein
MPPSFSSAAPLSTLFLAAMSGAMRRSILCCNNQNRPFYTCALQYTGLVFRTYKFL